MTVDVYPRSSTPPPMQMSGYRPLVAPAAFAAFAAAARLPGGHAATPDQATGRFLAGRSKGMWIFDTLLYPILSNTAVFALSVLATYMTTFGPEKNWFMRRGDWARAQMQKCFKMSPHMAEDAVMVIFSFLDGCIMAPVIKWMEDRKIKISRWLDGKLGSTPVNPKTYEHEPCQSWLSVLAGRATALALVLPAYKLLSRKVAGKASFNDVLFSRPGHRFGEWMLKKWPGLQKRFPNIKFPGLMKTCLFEGFYTTLCTAGMYLSSRLYAKLRDNH